jgi:hypothetical protein
MREVCDGNGPDAKRSAFPGRKPDGAAANRSTRYDARMTSPATVPAYRAPDAPERTRREVAIRAVAHWARRFGVGAAAMERAIERVEPLGDSTSLPTARDSLTGLPVVEAPFDPEHAPGPSPRTPHHRVYYRLATGAASVDVRTPDKTDTVEGDAGPLVRRAAFSLVSGALFAGAMFIARDRYLAPHAWFAAQPAASVLTVAILLVGLFAMLGTSEILLGRRARRGGVVALWFAALALSAGASAFTAARSRPSTAHIRSLWSAGHRAAATAEAEAYDALHPGAASEADHLQLRAIPADASPYDLVDQLRRPWRSPSSRTELITRLSRAADRAANDLMDSHSVTGEALEELADTVAEFLPDRRRVWLGRAAVLDARTTCVENGEPNARCVQRAMDRARDAGIAEAEIVQLQADFVRLAREWLQTQLTTARAEPDGFARAAQLTRVESFARSLSETQRVETGVDLAARRDEIRLAPAR